MQCTRTGVDAQDKWILTQLIAAVDQLETYRTIARMAEYLGQLKRQASEAGGGRARSS